MMWTHEPPRRRTVRSHVELIGQVVVGRTGSVLSAGMIFCCHADGARSALERLLSAINSTSRSRLCVSDIFPWTFPLSEIPPKIKSINLTLTITLILTLLTYNSADPTLTLLTPLLTVTLTEQGRRKCPRGELFRGKLSISVDVYRKRFR